MKSKSLFAISSVLLVMLLAISFVAASIDVNTYTPSRDFSITSAYNEVSICSCSTKYDSITITNTGTWPAIFTVSTNAIDSRLMLSQNSFELSPGQSQEVFLYITALCSKGSEDLRITVTSNLGPQKTLDKRIVRDRCQNIEMWVTNYTKDVKPCQSKTFEINVHNVGPFPENYVISSNYDNYITYNAKAFSLEQNEYAKISATVKFDCNIYGQKDILFSIQSLKNGLRASLNAGLNILQDYDYDLIINNDGEDVNVQVCNRMHSNIIPVSITNKGSIPNNYVVTFDKLPKQVKIEGLVDDKFSLNPYEAKTFYINVDSSSYLNEHKTKTFFMTINPEYGDIVKSASIALEFMTCYDHQVVIYDGDNSQNRPLETCSQYDYSYDVEIINNGVFNETYRLSLDGAPLGTKLSVNEITVESGKREGIKLFILGPEFNEYYNIVVKASISNGIIEQDDVWIKSYDLQTCHDTTISKNDFRINYQTQEINIPLKNNGITPNTYIVSWNGSDILSSDVQLVSLNGTNMGNNKYSIKLPVNTKDKEEGLYVGKLTILDNSGARYFKDISVELKDKSTIRKTFEYLISGNVCRQISLFEIFAILLVILLIIIFLIKGPHYPYTFGNRFKAKIPVLVFLIVLFLIGAILVIIIAGIPKTNTQVYNLTTNDSGLTYEWLQDDKYVLDVSRFFYDPENSTLRYEVDGLTHIIPLIKGNSITFYPESGWSGTEYAKITAFDKLGGNVTSPEFKLTVASIPKKTNLELYNIYCWYVNLAIFAILLIFIYIAAFVKQKKRARK